ncbi:hypothetical protein H257_15257 [Aphanomyces astaci]|uniref:Uncharacterized protein n=1 Tax=Aphanomyces astaci TaxID=112090 RepID=W4FN27_APHAT|nr:hypothetical protein H257_15257 [Aphanomyces astaci]ETV68912.1 hypothetical protein H257_15257 [Aphanomyces astaci]|eukprot:XP_009841589.1 hypothetical protein H257_15257 [Aphanomyces astaci]
MVWLTQLLYRNIDYILQKYTLSTETLNQVVSRELVDVSTINDALDVWHLQVGIPAYLDIVAPVVRRHVLGRFNSVDMSHAQVFSIEPEVLCCGPNVLFGC